MNITGLDKVLVNLGKITNIKVVDEALMDTADKILQLSDPKVPLIEGILNSSGTKIKERHKVLVGYNSEYAAYQHQGIRKDGSRKIINRPGGGESFFLTKTIDENRNQLIAFTNERIKANLNKLL